MTTTPGSRSKGPPSGIPPSRYRGFHEKGPGFIRTKIKKLKWTNVN